MLCASVAQKEDHEVRGGGAWPRSPATRGGCGGAGGARPGEGVAVARPGGEAVVSEEPDPVAARQAEEPGGCTAGGGGSRRVASERADG